MADQDVTQPTGPGRPFFLVPGLQTARSYQRERLAKDVGTGIVLTTLLVPQGTTVTAKAAGPGGNHPQTGDDIPRRLDQDRAQAAGGPGKRDC
jgi:hypothetical protein